MKKLKVSTSIIRKDMFSASQDGVRVYVSSHHNEIVVCIDDATTKKTFDFRGTARDFFNLLSKTQP
jgi:hypothetical protein